MECGPIDLVGVAVNALGLTQLWEFGDVFGQLSYRTAGLVSTDVSWNLGAPRAEKPTHCRTGDKGRGQVSDLTREGSYWRDTHLVAKRTRLVQLGWLWRTAQQT